MEALFDGAPRLKNCLDPQLDYAIYFVSPKHFGVLIGLSLHGLSIRRLSKSSIGLELNSSSEEPHRYVALSLAIR